MLSIYHSFSDSIASRSLVVARHIGTAAREAWQAFSVVPMFVVMVFALALGSFMVPRTAWADLGEGR